MNQQVVNEISRRINEMDASIHVISNMLTTIKAQDFHLANKYMTSNYLAINILNVSNHFRLKDCLTKTKHLKIKLRVANNGFVDGYKLNLNTIMIQGNDGDFCGFPREQNNINKEITIKYHNSEILELIFLVPRKISEFTLLIQDLHGLRAAEYYSLSKRK